MEERTELDAFAQYAIFDAKIVNSIRKGKKSKKGYIEYPVDPKIFHSMRL